MASPIISFAQKEVVIPCDLCEMPANSYCRKCLFQICDDCKQSHLDHAIVPVIEGLFEKLHVIKCSKHNSRFTKYCKLCRVNICNKCTITDHRGHEIEHVGKQAKMLKQNCSQKISKKKAHLRRIQAPLLRIKNQIEYVEKHTQSQIDKVHSEIDRKKELLDKEGERIIESLKQENKIASKKLNTHYRQLKFLDDKLNKLIESMEAKLASIPDEAVYNFVIENEKELETSTASLTFDLPCPSVFNPSTYKYKGQSDVLGSLTRFNPTNLNITFDPHPDSLLDAKQSTPTDPPSGVSVAQVAKTEVMGTSLRRELNIISRFRTTGVAVLSIGATDDDMLWVGTFDRKLVLVDKTGKQKLKVNIPDVPRCTTVTRAGDALVSTLGHVIYKVTRRFFREPEVSTFVDVYPGTVHGITTTQDGDVFACVDTGSVLWRVYKVKKFSDEGKFVLELDSTMFTPGNDLRYVHAVRDDVICIQDGDARNNAECPLVFVTAAGQLVSRVIRTEKLREYTEAIVWDDHGNILIGERWGECMHVFSGKGTCIHSYKVKGASEGIYTLCLGKDGAVWIVTWGGEVINARYLQ